MPDYYQRIKQQYINLQGDSTELFNEILTVSNEIGMDEALAYLGQCASEKRLAWLQANLDETVNENDPVMEAIDGFTRNI